MFFLLTSMRKVFALAWVIKTLCAIVSFFFFFFMKLFFSLGGSGPRLSL